MCRGGGKMFKKSAKKPDNPFAARFNPIPEPGEAVVVSQDQLQQAADYFGQLHSAQMAQNMFGNALSGIGMVSDPGQSSSSWPPYVTAGTTTSSQQGQTYYTAQYTNSHPWRNQRPSERYEEATPAPAPKPVPMTEDPKFAEAIDFFVAERSRRG